MTFHELMTEKVRILEPETSVYEAALVMNQAGVEAIIVANRSQVVGSVGIQDIIRNGFLDERSSKATRLEEIMAEPRWAYEDEPVEDTQELDHSVYIVKNRDERLVGTFTSHKIRASVVLSQDARPVTTKSRLVE
ncbi:MAG TPA: CBS domain-containing protein [Fimbriimonas sp.]|nr:CBS domain-containing protein [Fimbriimonas sp.]